VAGLTVSDFWDAHARTIDPAAYRADRQYLGCQAEYPYEAMVRHVLEGHGAWVYAAQPDDDGAYGATTRLVQGRMVSRDLLDSCVELGYLARQLGIYQLAEASILDIGAGYGRLAHRLHVALPTARVYCADTVAASREVCAQYLAHRGVEPRVYAPSELDRLPAMSLAVAVHSWPECTLAEVQWWLGWLADHKVPHLYVVPHDRALTCEWGSSPGPWAAPPHAPSFAEAIAMSGYELTDEWHGPACWPRAHHLYKRVR